MSTKIYNDLMSDLLGVAEGMTGETADSRFKTWAKRVTSVDPGYKDGYAFSGDWVSKGTVELTLGKPGLALVSFRHGSMRYNYGEYAIVKITASGDLEATEIQASDTDGQGWALRIRDDVIALLDELEQPQNIPTTIAVHLGSGAQAQVRKGILESMAARGGYPTVDEWLCATADADIG